MNKNTFQILTYTKRTQGNPRVDAELYFAKKLGLQVILLDNYSGVLKLIYDILERIPAIFWARYVIDRLLIKLFARNKPDMRLCICHDYFSALYCHWIGIPYLLNMEEYYPGEYDDGDIIDASLARYKFLVLRTISKTCMHYFVESFSVKKRLSESLEIMPSQISILSNKPISSSFTPIIKNKSIDNINLIYFGYITKKRNIHAFVRLLQLREDITLTLVGPANQRYLRQLNHIARKEKRLVIKDSMELEKLYAQLSQYDLSLSYFLSRQPHHRYYTCPNKFWQSLYSGLPVVVSKESAMSEYVKSYDVGVVIDPNSDEWILNIDKDDIYTLKNNIHSMDRNGFTAGSEIDVFKEIVINNEY